MNPGAFVRNVSNHCITLCVCTSSASISRKASHVLLISSDASFMPLQPLCKQHLCAYTEVASLCEVHRGN